MVERDILVFGASGQVGQCLAASPRVHGLTRAEADLEDPDACARIIAEAEGIAGVINAAAWTAVDDAEAHEAQVRVVNADAPAEMARACAMRDIPFVHYSTDYVFDGAGQGARRPGDTTDPLSVYGRTKLAGENAIAAVGGTAAILRTAWVFSATPPNFVAAMLRLSETRNLVSVVSDQIGGPTPASALAEAGLTMVVALATDPTKAGIYHLSGTPEVSWADFARTIFAMAKRDVTVKDIATADWPTSAARPLNSRLDCTDTENVFGITRPDWRAALLAIITELSP